MNEAIERYKGNYCTVYKLGGLESIVYGEGSDWIAQMSNVTNHNDRFRKWFAHREDAETKAKEMLISNDR